MKEMKLINNEIILVPTKYIYIFFILHAHNKK